MLTVIIALAANTTLAILKSIVAVLTGSASMVAEAAHSWADAGNEVFLVIAERRAEKPADATHPLGFGREASVWSLIAAFGLFGVGAGVSVWHGIQSLTAEETEADYLWAYVVLGAAFVLESISFFQARREVRRGARKADVSRVTFLDKTSNPTLRAVFFEDAAALVGIVIAVTGLVLHQVTHQPVWDAIGSILVGLLLGVVAVFLIGRNRDYLVGQAVRPELWRQAFDDLSGSDEVERVTFLHLEFVGPGKVFLVAAVDLTGDDTEAKVATRLAELGHRIEEHELVELAMITLSRTDAPTLVP